MLSELHKLFKLIWQKKKNVVITNYENIFYSVYGDMLQWRVPFSVLVINEN